MIDIDCKFKSINYDNRAAGATIDMLVLHYTGMKSAEAALTRLCDPKAKVSAHYLVDEDGAIYSLVPEDKRAWHAGISCWRGRPHVNDHSVGIELVNPGHEFGYRDFPEAQIKALTALSRSILERHAIPARNVVGHSDIAPLRKQDPGELFDWRRLAKAGIGVWPRVLPVGTDAVMLRQGDIGDGVLRLQERLAKYGYLITPDKYFGEETCKVACAFQRHFCPECVDGVWRDRNEITLNQLLEVVAASLDPGAPVLYE